jgi:hypothetical protein
MNISLEDLPAKKKQCLQKISEVKYLAEKHSAEKHSAKKAFCRKAFSRKAFSKKAIREKQSGEKHITNKILKQQGKISILQKSISSNRHAAKKQRVKKNILH